MLKFSNNKLIPLTESDLKTNGLLERFNLQEAIANSWKEFTKEIKYPELIYIGKEVIPDNSTLGRIDILAYDPNENVPVVIELKRSKDKYQLLQSISYAAMVSNWTNEMFIQEANKNKNEKAEEIEGIITRSEEDSNVKIILVAERFDPEVIISTDWLIKNSYLKITAISLSVFKKDDDLYFSFDQKYPLPELNEIYELRNRKKSKTVSKDKERSWKDVSDALSYDWGPEFLEKCLKEASGDSNRSRFIHLRKDVDGLKAISFFFRRNYLNVYILGKLEDPDSLFKSIFSSGVELNEWLEGYSIHLTTRKEYEELCRWLNF
ncbi:hypothetical protein M899_1043 [Bacteriovorax sp. BSW11_IV]|uniref:hypothetical protein n=1 Tax=Bacteriovorax sp. BSW11_IV TaxID=1353529 RepID=UPI00038A4EB7|nr:hypothetical protein [Bacteriovorax sp. BSW11_IV]EQC48646.1 hypothetical protein M899_1043 [Bacteriovorax sp. BSW11_IV]